MGLKATDAMERNGRLAVVVAIPGESLALLPSITTHYVGTRNVVPATPETVRWDPPGQVRTRN